MSSLRTRYWMRADTSRFASRADIPSRHLTFADGQYLGDLMYRAYHGSIDDDGETPEDFMTEAQAMLKGKHGDMLFFASHVIEENSRFISASIITFFKNEALLALSLTDPESRGRGLAGYLIQRSLSSLAEQGYKTAKLIVTAGNHDAEHLYRKLGFSLL